MSKNVFVVTTSVGAEASRSSWSRVWSGALPLSLGHPMRWTLERTAEGVRVRFLGQQAGEINENSERLIKSIPYDKIDKGASIPLYDSMTGSAVMTLQIRPMRDWASPCTIIEPQFRADEVKPFKNALKYAAVIFGAFTIAAWLWPKVTPLPTEELIPPQFAKLVLTPIKKQPEPAGSRSGGSQVKVTKAKDAAVVQAFRAKALQSAVSGLLKGGMTTLLAQSDFVTGTAASAGARRIFNTKHQALVPTAQATGLMNGRQVKVAGVGGAGAGAGGAGVGYGKGAHAGVAGQGTSQVSMDIEGSKVEEGLTKDEVGAVIHSHLSEIRYCYESAMIRTPDIEGKLIVDFIISSAGSVKSTAVKNSTLSDPRLDDCILRRLATWKFPQPKGKIDVAVTYPFIFKTLGR